MKKKLFYGIAVLAIAVVAAWNVNVSSKGSGFSDISFANVEALAVGETSEEFTEATCCIACWDNHNCHSCDGNIYSYAHRQ